MGWVIWISIRKPCRILCVDAVGVDTWDGNNLGDIVRLLHISAMLLSSDVVPP